MEYYSRVCRNSTSPLTPLTPLNSSVFNFNIDERPSTSQLVLPSTRRCTARRDSSSGLESVSELCQIFGQGLCSTVARLSSPRSCESGLKKRRTNMAAAAGLGFPQNSSRGHISGYRPALPAQSTSRSIKRETTRMPEITIEPPCAPRPSRTRRAYTTSQRSIKYEMEDCASFRDARDDDDYDESTRAGSLRADGTSFSSWEAGLTPTTTFFRSPTSRSTSRSHSSSQQQLQSQQQQQRARGTQARHFDASNVRLSSPVPPKPMSPRFGAFLARWGINCLQSIFERQEIDMQTFCCLSADDLELLGIQDPENRHRAIQAINFLAGFLTKNRNIDEFLD